jgi:hypothetical protein
MAAYPRRGRVGIGNPAPGIGGNSETFKKIEHAGNQWDLADMWIMRASGIGILIGG